MTASLSSEVGTYLRGKVTSGQFASIDQAADRSLAQLVHQESLDGEKLVG